MLLGRSGGVFLLAHFGSVRFMVTGRDNISFLVNMATLERYSFASVE